MGIFVESRFDESAVRTRAYFIWKRKSESGIVSNEKENWMEALESIRAEERLSEEFHESQKGVKSLFRHRFY